MKQTLIPGLEGTRRIVIDPARTIDFLGDTARVYATPAMVNDVEYACRDFLLDHLDDGEDSVGSRVEIDHLAATPIGWSIEIAFRVAAIEGRRIAFHFEVRDAVETVGRGRHHRVVIDRERHARRLAAKATSPDPAGD